jgi:hypothetical protein
MWLFFTDYLETVEKDENSNIFKLFTFKELLAVFEYNKKNKIFIYLSGEIKFNQLMKMEDVKLKINNIEIHDEVNVKTFNMFELKNSIFSLYHRFSQFLSVYSVNIGNTYANKRFEFLK